MKNSSLFGAVLFIGLLATAFTLPSAEPLTSSERKYAVDYFQKTKQRLLNDVKGLSAAQLNFKADTSRWSIAQCLEHIAISESMIWQWIQGTLQQPATPGEKNRGQNQQ